MPCHLFGIWCAATCITAQINLPEYGAGTVNKTFVCAGAEPCTLSWTVSRASYLTCAYRSDDEAQADCTDDSPNVVTHSDGSPGPAAATQ